MRGPTQTQFEDLFVKACWIYEVWDVGNKRAQRYKEAAQQHLDPQWCVRTSHQVTDLELRKRWLEARREGSPLPRVTSAVRRHFESEFAGSFPEGVTDPDDSTP